MAAIAAAEAQAMGVLAEAQAAMLAAGSVESSSAGAEAETGGKRKKDKEEPTPVQSKRKKGPPMARVEVALHERFLNSEHRTLDASAADFYFVPSYLACVILPVYDFTGHAEYMHGYPMRPITAMRMSLAALHTIRARFPYWNASGGADHLFLFAHDEGACW